MKISPLDHLFFKTEESGMAPVMEGMALACSSASTHRKLVLGFQGCAEKLGSMDVLVAGAEQGYGALL